MHDYIDPQLLQILYDVQRNDVQRQVRAAQRMLLDVPQLVDLPQLSDPQLLGFDRKEHARIFAFLEDMMPDYEKLTRTVLNPQLLESLNAFGKTLDHNLNSLYAATRAMDLPVEIFDISSIISQLPDLGQLIPQLPAPAKLIRHWEELQEGEEATERLGYGFATNHLDFQFVIGLPNYAPQIQGAIATNRLRAATARKQFEIELESKVARSGISARRWEPISAAIGAHRRREYLLSVPVLIAQTEGVVGEMIVLKGLAQKKNGKFYALNPDGTKKLNRRGKPVELPGLKTKAIHARFANHPALKALGSHITDHLVEDRNSVLHGTNTAYGTAKLSTQLLLTLLVLYSEIDAYCQSDS